MDEKLKKSLRLLLLMVHEVGIFFSLEKCLLYTFSTIMSNCCSQLLKDSHQFWNKNKKGFSLHVELENVCAFTLGIRNSSLPHKRAIQC